MPLYKVLDPNKENAANIELSCDQSGIGFTPIKTSGNIARNSFIDSMMQNYSICLIWVSAFPIIPTGKIR